MRRKPIRLENGGVRYVVVRESAAIETPENASLPKAEPKHVGGGWYELPSGERVRGKEEAIRKTKG